MKAFFLGLSLLLAIIASAEEPAVTQPAFPEKVTPTTVSDYPIDYCPVSGEKLGSMGDPIVFYYEGREIRFCCSACIKTFKKNPSAYFAQLDQAVIERQREGYPLDICVVSGGKLSEKGKPINYVYKNQLVELCSDTCVVEFNKDPQKYLKMIDAARASDAPAAPAEE